MIPLIVGGNSGLGLAIAKSFYDKGATRIYIIGKEAPDFFAIDANVRDDFRKKVVFKIHNFISINLDEFNDFLDCDSLIITTGFGRLALFEDLAVPEVKNLMEVNFVAVTQIIKFFYNKIANNNDFYTMVVVSICGQIVSPFFSVYGASKGGLRFLIENLNCELSNRGFKNRILDVSPGSLSGTSFSGGPNKLNNIEKLANEAVNKMFNRETLFIPSYNETYKNVLERYNNDKILFGKQSFEYKESTRIFSNKPQLIIGYLSGTFDLFHVGHLNLLKRAKEQCDYLIVSVHKSGSWKGKETFIPYSQRKEIVKSIKYVDEVVDDFLEDSDAWEKYHYNKLFVGSDYKGTDRFNRYEQILSGKAEIVYFEYTKGICSTQIREELKKQK